MILTRAMGISRRFGGSTRLSRQRCRLLRMMSKCYHSDIHKADAWLSARPDPNGEKPIVITMRYRDGESTVYSLTPDAALTLRNDLSTALKAR